MLKQMCRMHCGSIAQQLAVASVHSLMFAVQAWRCMTGNQTDGAGAPTAVAVLG